MGASAETPSRAAERIAETARSGHDLVSFWRAVSPLLQNAVPHFESPCFFTVDPSSLLITSHFQEGLPELPADWLAREYTSPDYNSMAAVFESSDGVGTLHDATAGRPELSLKYHEEMVPYGCEQELLVALRTPDGETWGAMGLYRERGRTLFTDQDKAFLRAVAPSLAVGVRRGLLQAEASEPDLPDAPGAVVLDSTLRVISCTESAFPLLAALGGTGEAMPAAVAAVAGAAAAEQESSARARTKSGGWLVLHGSRFLDGTSPTRTVLVILEPAQPARLAPLLMSAYGLTPRERDVAGLVLAGHTTRQCARLLAISEHTVQQHVQTVFAKTGVRSRRELTGRVFGAHYEPRVRDNEARTGRARPARGGPMPG